MYINWAKSYETGHPLIDAEHRILVMLFKKLDVAIKTRQSDEILARTVMEVRKFVDFHFVSEENLMLETNYPGAASHHKIHTALMVEFNAKISRVVSHREYPEDLLDFLCRWLVNHIAGHDQKVAKHILEASKRPVAENIYDEYLVPAKY